MARFAVLYFSLKLFVCLITLIRLMSLNFTFLWKMILANRKIMFLWFMKLFTSWWWILNVTGVVTGVVVCSLLRLATCWWAILKDVNHYVRFIYICSYPFLLMRTPFEPKICIKLSLYVLMSRSLYIYLTEPILSSVSFC